MENRAGTEQSLQISKMGIIKLDKDFDLQGSGFNIKNDGAKPVTLKVKLDMMGEYIETRFAVGWNPEIVVSIKQPESSGLDLKWGM